MHNKPDSYPDLRSAWQLLIYLFRFKEDIFYVSMTTLFGIIAADGKFGWQLILILSCNWLATELSNVFRSINEAPSDVISGKNGNGNPIAKGEISLKLVRRVAGIACMISLACFFLIGWEVGAIGLVLIIFGWGCRKNSNNLPKTSYAFLICQSFIKAAFPFLTAFFVFQSQLNKIWFYPFMCMLAFKIYIDSSGLIKEIKLAKNFSERSFAYFSEKGSQFFALIFLGIGILTGLISIVFLDMIPLWVTILIVALALIFLIPQFMRIKQAKNLLHIQTPLHVSIEKSVAIALLMQFLIPWLIKFF